LSTRGRRLVDQVATVVAVIAAGAWLGGLLVLGAIVAPVVFHTVPAPTSADAMTIVFRRFDGVAMACGAVLAVAEVVRVRTSGVDRRVATRVALAAVAVAVGLVMGLWVSPEIARLHELGAIRGLDPLGERLDAVHNWATRLGKVEAIALIGVITLHVLPKQAGTGTRASTP
jgi:putative copper export protein